MDLVERFWDLAEGLRDFWVLRKDFGISRKDIERKSVQDPVFLQACLFSDMANSNMFYQ